MFHICFSAVGEDFFYVSGMSQSSITISRQIHFYVQGESYGINNLNKNKNMINLYQYLCLKKDMKKLYHGFTWKFSRLHMSLLTSALWRLECYCIWKMIVSNALFLSNCCKFHSNNFFIKRNNKRISFDRLVFWIF